MQASEALVSNVLVITTGGTISARPYQDPRRPPPLCSADTESIDPVQEALAASAAAINIRFAPLSPRDSKLIDDLYRRDIVATIEEASECAVLITHGTDTILDTCDYLFAHLPSSLDWKRIILTGSMTPLANGSTSDGRANLGYSLDRLRRRDPALEKLNVVLHDFDKDGAWKPRLYPYRPNRYRKLFGPDARFNRIQFIE